MKGSWTDTLGPPADTGINQPELPDNATILGVIQSSREALEGKTGEVQGEMSLMQQDLQNV